MENTSYEIAAVNAAANVATSAVNNAGYKNSQRRANKYNTEMYNRQRADAVADRNLAREWALQDWNTQNEYNSPKNQMQRYRDANLNPNLIYGEGVSASSGNSSNMPTATDTRASQFGNSPAAKYNMDLGLANFSQMLLLDKQAKVLDSQAEKNYADAGLSDTREKEIKAMLPINQDTGLVNIEMAKSRINEIATSVLLNTKEMDVKTQSILESNAKVKKMFNDTLLSYMQLQNEITRTDVQKGTLAAHQADVAIRAKQQHVNEQQYLFEKDLKTLQYELNKLGVTTETFGNPFKIIGTLLRGSVNRTLPGFELDSIQPIQKNNKTRPIYAPNAFPYNLKKR